ERARLHRRQSGLNELALANAPKIDPCEHDDADQRHQALRAESEVDRVGRIGAPERRDAHVALREPAVQIGGYPGPQHAEESPERDGHGRDGARLDDDKERPAIQKAHEWPHGLAEEDVLAAGAWE